MRAANESLLRWTGQVPEHNFSHDWLRLDIEFTALLASKWAQGGEKGYFPPRKKTRTGRDSHRLAAIDYREVLLSQLYPGAQTSFASTPQWCANFNGFYRSPFSSLSAA